MTKQATPKSTIKNDPFAALIPAPSEPTPPEEELSKPVRASLRLKSRVKPVNDDPPKGTSKPEKTVEVRGKQKLTVHLDSFLAERVKNAAYWNPKLTIARIAEQGIKSALERYEREHGGQYPQREGELVGGRPIK